MWSKSRRICGDGLAEVIKSVGQSTEEVRNRIDVVLFSGGSGTQSITEALLAHPQIHLHILINAYDDGLSTGRLRQASIATLGPSDVRKNISRLMPSTERCHEVCNRYPRTACRWARYAQTYCDS